MDDFESFLHKVSEEEALKRYAREVHEHVWNIIEKHDPPRVIDRNPDRQEALVQEAIAHYEALLYQNALRHPDHYPSDHEELDQDIHFKAVSIVSQEQIDQHMIADAIGKLIIHHNYLDSSDPQAYQAFIDTKKSLTAHLIVVREVPPDNPWIAVVNEAIPGDNLDPHSPKDMSYMSAAMEAVANESHTVGVREIYQEACRIADVTNEDPAERATVVIHMLLIGQRMQALSQENAAAERRARLAEIGREGSLTPKVIQALTAFIDETYPIRSM